MFSDRTPSADDVFTLADLERWPDKGTWLAILGHPIKHSISPAMQNAALDVMARDDPTYSSWRYVRFDVVPEDLPQALKAFHLRGFRGLNLTVPHKVIGFPCVHDVDTAARAIGAVNTLRWRPEGWQGFNTDGYGLATGLKEDLNADLRAANVILLGAGGAARSAAVECVRQGCASVSIGNRTLANAEALIELLRALNGTTQFRAFDPHSPPRDLPEHAWLINATSAGLHAQDPIPVDLAAIPRPAGVYDMIYNPAQTRLLALAHARGIPTANGLSMLIHQGARGLALWTDAAVPVEAMRRGAHAAMAR